MTKITVTDTLSLSIPERIQLVEDIWDSIVAHVDEVELTDEEKILIDERLESFHSNPQKTSSWDEVFMRIVNRREV